MKSFNINNVFRVVVVLLVFAVLYKYYFESPKVVYINTAKLMEASIDMKDARAAVKKEQQILQSNIDTLTIEFQNAIKGYEKNASSMSLKEREMAKELLETKRVQAMQYKQNMEQKFTQIEQEKTRVAINKINSAIDAYGKKHHYQLILATAQGSLVYGDVKIDITEAVIEVVNEK